MDKHPATSSMKINVGTMDDPQLKVHLVTLNVYSNYINNLYKLANEVSAQPHNATRLAAFRVRCKDLCSFRDKFQEAFTVISAHAKDDKMRSEIEASCSSFHDMYYSIQVLQESILQANPPQAVQNSSASISSQFCLPKISIEPFTGNYTDWPSFIALFNSLVHNNNEIGDVRKMHYLINFLDKEPKMLVKHLELSADNYFRAYGILKDRYENTRLIADKHLELILSVGNLSQQNLNSNLRKFVNTIKENMQALAALKFDVNSWSFILLHIMLRKLPIDLRSLFELEHCAEPNIIPTFTDLLKFLEARLRVLDTVTSAKGTSYSSGSGSSHANAHKAHTVSAPACVCCKGSHGLFNCDKFNSMSPAQRRDVVSSNRLCYNCLRNHSVSNCFSKSTCQLCHGRHHTKLHLERQVSHLGGDLAPQPTTEAAVSTLSSTVQPLSSHGIHRESTMLLGTALVGVQDVNGYLHKVRALLDSGSQVTIITENLAQKLRLPRSTSSSLYGLGGTVSQKTNGNIECSINSMLDTSKPALVTTAAILKRITGNLPSVQISPAVSQKCFDISLADSKFSTPGPIDILIGVDLHDQVFDGRKLQLGEGLPTAYGSVFGWVLMGKAPMNSTSQGSFSHLSVSLFCTPDLDSTLSKFWEIEEVPTATVQDPESVLCEKHFADTHTRDSTGRFIVRLPFKTVPKPLGETFTNALKRFYNLERKLLRDPKLKELYSAFMDDYLKAGHMRPVTNASSHGRYYIPHHGVLKESSSTTKLRAVFDASAPSSTGVSLNQVLMPGPKLQQNIEDIILRFRTHATVFTCDIKQMYRQVLLHAEDCKYQTIFWRETPDQPIQQFELSTVTYGVSSAAYLAMRVIHELATLNQVKFPEAARVLLEDTFVDDVISGCSDVQSTKALQQDIVEILGQGGFQLRKWVSNCDKILDGYPTEHLETPFRFEESGDHIFKILGVEWNAKSDSFIYRVSKFGKCSTKRQILSNIARIYDPCGYVAPITFYAKLLMQRLWAYDLGWDDALPERFLKLWESFADSFGLLSLPHIPRFILSCQPLRCELIGFCDASESGFAAVIYLRVLDSSGDVAVHLLSAKSRVAPIKQRLTIPRLELSGAILLARLIGHALGILEKRIVITETIAWCDSSIVLAWLRTPPHKLQTFEGNRVSQIQGLVPFAQWRHVPSALNPADCASRGLLPSDLVNHSLWWSPQWLKEDPASWPAISQQMVNDDIPGLKSPDMTTLNIKEADLDADRDSVFSLIERYSSLSRLQRVLAWSLRFVRNARNATSNLSGPLSVQELDTALLTIVKVVQADAFSAHIDAIRKDRAVKGAIASLHPFLDSDGLVRVGGRLEHSNLPYSVKHPLLLPKSHHLTSLIVDHFHLKYLHVGAMSLMNILRQSYWILSARSIIRYRIHRCQRCYRLKAKPLEPFMGNLPPSRIRQARPFLRAGIDFAGPFNIKTSTIRNAKIRKAYLCLFVCLTTKAVHLEVVSELSTDAFMASFHRFVARRGMVADVYSDRGKNFQGAKRYLNEVDVFIQDNSKSLNDAFTTNSVKWHMNPPYAPHMGGLWESSVKSAKQLLKRSVGDQVLTFEELTTVFAKVEAVLNSRPLCPMSENPNDVETLTPGHFLIGQPLVSLPDYNFDNSPISRLNRWQLVQQITQHFWRRWQLEYLHTLQQRAKWCKKIPNLQLGDLVLIKADNVPPLNWAKGRVSKLHPGADGIVRVAELKTATGSCLRSVAKLCPLPLNN